MQQNYTLGMEFVGRLNDNGLRQVKYDDENNDNRFVIVIKARTINRVSKFEHE